MTRIMNQTFRMVASATALMLSSFYGVHAAQIIEEVLVIGTKEDARKVAGSGSVINKEDLDRQDQTDLNQILASVPGLYFREEDGYGLRPNIGIRGATTDRSQKITMMEDGVLIGPAPYSAPAAYYVPNVARMSAVEVLKGPSAIKYGPHTVGGAINFVTADVPDEDQGEVDLSYGSDAYAKVEGFVAKPIGDVGVLVDFLRYQSDGFKELDGGGDSGFERNDINVKLKWQPQTELQQSVTLKLGFADEDSDETYLGLTDADFISNPDRRYRASSLDNFSSKHRLMQINYGVRVNEGLQINVKAYRNEFERAWNKFDGLLSGTATQKILANPKFYGNQYLVLTGAVDSIGVAADTIDVTNNDREFMSSGLQISVNLDHQLFGVNQTLSSGIRYHYDEVDREHKQRGYLMRSGQLVFDGVSRNPKVVNHAETDAYSVYFSNDFQFERLLVTLGVRHEDISGSVDNLLIGVESANDQQETSPGMSVFFPWNDSLSLVAGVHRGFSPSGPGSSGVSAEESVNYEAGMRFQRGKFFAEAIGFFSDYSNLLGRCRISDFGCQPGDEFSGGAVEIYGLETMVDYSILLGEELSFSLNGSYTYTHSEFQDSFLSTFSQFGIVRAGDELPYLPQHMANIDARLTNNSWELSASIKYQSEMREEPGSRNIQSDLHAEDYTVVDLGVTWFISEPLALQLLARNAADDRAIVSHRPFGARPNLPRTLILRAKYTFL
jgi:Fe(3+) dicitrate transport protein